ncbi:uncharacterized protein LOC128883365 isoform X2 [Hylaeus volcanicus]|uniref:uncharacterized protein LOC128883365 isoform X2 n=1 Tax=Hylaeus volcanicus TaxID=313075 RepID=UPI0023B77B52|nr:uncharacterized protein LOC128883365 isoform X2 [Hylaeus volcanicus]
MSPVFFYTAIHCWAYFILIFLTCNFLRRIILVLPLTLEKFHRDVEGSYQGTLAYVRSKKVLITACFLIHCFKLIFLIFFDVTLTAIDKTRFYWFVIFNYLTDKSTKEYEVFLHSPVYKDRPKTRPVLVSKQKKIFFVRHGESLWNKTFNRPNVFVLPLRILYILFLEFFFFFSHDSILCDSPLSTSGENQAFFLKKWIQNKKTKTSTNDFFLLIDSNKESIEKKEKLNNNEKDLFDLDVDSSLIVVSNLRRAMSTATLAMPINPQHEERRLYVLPFLQEATRNVDGYPLSCLSQFFTLSRIFPSLDTPNSTWGASKNFFLKSSLNTTNSLMTLFDHQYNTSSAYESLSLLKRLSLFATWIFSQNTPASTADTIIIIGHSIWLRKFLERYLPVVN